jgi:hypothetical protein
MTLCWVYESANGAKRTFVTTPGLNALVRCDVLDLLRLDVEIGSAHW